MAQESTLWRLHRAEEIISTGAAEIPQPVKLANLANSQPDVPAPAPHATRLTGFRVHRDDAEIDYRVGAAQLMSNIATEAPLNQSARFRDLAMRDQAEQLIERYGRRMRRF